MLVRLRNDIIDILKKFLGDSIPKDCFRSGRIEYETIVESELILNIEIDDQDIEIFKKECPTLYRQGKSPKDYVKIEVLQRFWIENEIVVATGISFSSDSKIESILAQLFFITDEFGTPFFEDTKLLEWELSNELKIILILPKKINKDEKRLNIICGKKQFFDKTDVWKTNL